jgi:hypothetical protein
MSTGPISGIEDRKVEVAEAHAFSNDIDPRDPGACDGKTERPPQVSTWRPHEPHRSIH